MSKKKEPTPPATYGTYRDCPIISLPVEGTDRRLAFGFRKAQAVIQHIKEIKTFVRKHEKEHSTK